MSQFERYLNIINELKVPEIGLKNAKLFNILNIKFNKLFGQKDYESRLKLPDGNFKQLWDDYFKNDKHPFKIKKIDDNFENFLKKYSIIRSSKEDEEFLTFLNNIFSALKDLRLDPIDLSQEQNKIVLNVYFNYKYKKPKEIPEWNEIKSAMTGSIAVQIRENKLNRKVIKDLLEMLKKSAYNFVNNDKIKNVKIKDYIKNPSIIHKIVAGEI